MIEIGNIITLENNMDFLIIEETIYDNNKYVLTVLTDKEDNILNKYMIFKVISKDEGFYLDPVKDNDLCKKLYELFKNITAM
jgi:hypothetical protein